MRHSNLIKYKRKGIKIKNSPFRSLKTSSIPFSPKAPNNAMWHCLPEGYISMPSERTLPNYEHINNFLRHNSQIEF